MGAQLLALAGSLRTGSYNQRLVDHAAEMAEAEGAVVTRLRLADYPLPLYSHELETTAFPPSAAELKRLFSAQDGFLIASPEHNGSVPAVLKNAFDWLSRPTGDETAIAFSAFRGKSCGIMAASPSPYGGLRGLAHLRQILNILQVLVVPEQVATPLAHQAFADGVLKDELPLTPLRGLVRRVVTLSAKEPHA